MIKQLVVNVKEIPLCIKNTICSFFVELGYKIKLRFAFYSKKFISREYIPLYIAFFFFIVMSIISAIVVVYDTNSHITSYRKMQQLFLESGYDLNKIRNKEMDVPRIFIQTLPSDFNMIESAKEKKELFIKFLLPLILKKNEELMEARLKLKDIQAKIEKSKHLSAEEEDFLNLMKDTYKTDTGEVKDILIKLDEISVSMALGQAIQETGWGDSRFLIQGNSIFAEWTWGGDGMLPRARKDGLVHRIKTFPTLYDSVDSYANNLNRTRYYAGFRQMRAKLREQDKPLYGRWLMSSMTRYSTQKDVYILEVKKIIRDNNLDDFNTVKLAKP